MRALGSIQLHACLLNPHTGTHMTQDAVDSRKKDKKMRLYILGTDAKHQHSQQFGSNGTRHSCVPTVSSSRCCKR